MSEKHLATFLQIDLQNLFYAARNKGAKIDFEKIWNFFRDRETEFLADAYLYMVRSPDVDSSKFESKMINVGYKLRIKNSTRIMRDNRSIYKQTNHDVGITVDCMDHLSMFDKWILMSGDGDFAELCSYIKKMEKKIEIWSFRECCNSNLESFADRLYFIEDKFFYHKPKITVFGFNREETPLL